MEETTSKMSIRRSTRQRETKRKREDGDDGEEVELDIDIQELEEEITACLERVEQAMKAKKGKIHAVLDNDAGRKAVARAQDSEQCREKKPVEMMDLHEIHEELIQLEQDFNNKVKIMEKAWKNVEHCEADRDERERVAAVLGET